tara:strand:- start:37 stop:684 length:648 start_codon:yes stop_codon:yes gene_type:complete
MGAGNAGSGGGRTDAGPNRTTAYKAGVGNINEKGKKTASYKSDNPDAFRNTGAEKIKKTVSKFPTPTMLIASKPLQAGSKVTRDFFTDKVLGSKNYKGTTKEKFSSMSRSAQESMYQSYIGGRTSGSTDAYGNTISQGGGNNTPVPTILKKTAGGQTVQTTAPTEAELSQSAAADAEAYDLRKTKKKGRSMTRLTSSQGVIDNKLTLGKPSLLGA